MSVPRRSYSNATTRVTGTFCGSADCGESCNTNSTGSTGLKCRYGGMICHDRSVYAAYWPTLWPANAVSMTSVVSCDFHINIGYCPGWIGERGGFCEASSGGLTNCFVVGNVTGPQPPPPAPPPPPALTSQCATAASASAMTIVAGVYCSPGNCPRSCIDQDSYSPHPNKCPSGALVCADGSVYAIFKAGWTPPAGAISGCTLLNCRIQTASGYCAQAQPGSVKPSYCEIESMSFSNTSCFNGRLLPAVAPPPLPSLPPAPATTTVCAHVTNSTTPIWVTGTLCVNGSGSGAGSLGSCPTTCLRGTLKTNLCKFGGFVCSDGSVYSNYYPWPVPSPAPPAGAIITCMLQPNPHFCNVSACEPAFDSVTSCSYTLPPSNHHHHGLGPGAIAGAVVGTIAGVSLLALVALQLLKASRGALGAARKAGYGYAQVGGGGGGGVDRSGYNGSFFTGAEEVGPNWATSAEPPAPQVQQSFVSASTAAPAGASGPSRGFALAEMGTKSGGGGEMAEEAPVGGLAALDSVKGGYVPPKVVL